MMAANRLRSKRNAKIAWETLTSSNKSWRTHSNTWTRNLRQHNRFNDSDRLSQQWFTFSNFNELQQYWNETMMHLRTHSIETSRTRLRTTSQESTSNQTLLRKWHEATYASTTDFTSDVWNEKIATLLAIQTESRHQQEKNSIILTNQCSWNWTR